MRRVLLLVAALIVPVAEQAQGQPANDDCANATVIGAIPFHDVVDVSTATEEGTDPAFDCASGIGAGSARPSTVWYRYTAPSAVNLVVRTYGSTYDTFMGAFRGTCGAFMSLAFCNDDHFDNNRPYGPADGEDATLYMTLDAGETVYIVVADHENSNLPGTLVFDVQPSPLLLANGFEEGEYYPRPAVGAGASGDFMVVWAARTGADDTIRGRVFDRKGRSVGPVFDIATADNSFKQSVAGDGAGNFMVVWGEYTSPHRIMARRLDGTGAPLGAPFQVNVGSVYAYPAVAADAAGDFVVSWNTGSAIAAQRIDASDVGLVSDLSVGTGYRSDVAMMPDGRFMVAWTDYSGFDGSSGGIAARRYDASGNPLGSAFVVNAYTTGFQGTYGPGIAVTASGDFLVAWSDYERTPLTVQARLFDVDENPLTGDFQVNTGAVTYGYYGVKYGDSFENHVSVAADGAGEFVVAWHRWASGAYGRRIDASGTPAGDEFQVGTFWANYQAYYGTDVAATAGGDFMVVWHDIDFNTAGEVFGRAFPTDAATTIGVRPTKLIVVDKVAATGKAKVVYVSKDQAAGIEKGPGADLGGVSARFDLAYDSASGGFMAPAGASDGTAGWKANKAAVAKYVNKDAGLAPAGAIKVTVVKTGTLVKVVAKGLGDDGSLDIVAAGAPVGPVQACYEIDNDGDRFRFGSQWAPGDCTFKEIAGGTGRKLLCKGGTGDATCGAAP